MESRLVEMRIYSCYSAKGKQITKRGEKVMKTIRKMKTILVLVLACSMLVGCDSKIDHDQEEQTITYTYNGEGYSFVYDDKWEVVTRLDTEVLQYKGTEDYFGNMGISALSDSVSDFEDEKEQKELYDTFLEYWDEELGSSGLTITKGTGGFNELTADISYAKYLYGYSSTELVGECFLLVCSEKNAIISFMTKTEGDIETIGRATLDILKTINVDEIEAEEVATEENDVEDSQNVVENDELYDYLDSMSNWNLYSNLRAGELGSNKSIEGGWRILSDSETYWTFRDGQFWWYKSVNDLSDNYWYGTTQIYTGEEGLAIAGLDESSLDSITEMSGGSVLADDIYTVVLTPTYLLLDGEDMSEENIPEGFTWNMIWIIVDHGTEGLEAQVLDMASYETSYYVKVVD